MDNGVNVGLLTPGGLMGSGLEGAQTALKLLQSGFNVNVLRDNTVLKKDEWIHFDNAVIGVARQRLVGVADLMSAGLSTPIKNALGRTRVEWQRQGDMTPAEISMSGVTEGRNDRLEFDLEGMPLPIIHKDFNINIRALHASRNNGEGLDTAQAELASRLVAEKMEDILFNGAANIRMQNSTIYGYKTAPGRNTGTVLDWSLSGTDGSEIVADVLAMIAKLNEDKMYGPFLFYIPLSWYIKLGDDYKANSDKTILQRVKEIPGVKDIRPSENLTTGVIAVQMTRDVVDLIDGMQPTTLMWESHGGMVFNFKVMAIMAPRFRNTITGQSGLAHFVPA